MGSRLAVNSRPNVYVTCGLGGSFRGFRFRCSRFSVATPLTVVHLSSPRSTHSPCLRRPWPLCPGLVRETGQERIRCHGSLSGIIEIGRSHYYFSRCSTLFRNTAPVTGSLLPQDHSPEEIRLEVFEVWRVCWEKTSTRMAARCFGG